MSSLYYILSLTKSFAESLQWPSTILSSWNEWSFEYKYEYTGQIPVWSLKVRIRWQMTNGSKPWESAGRTEFCKGIGELQEYLGMLMEEHYGCGIENAWSTNRSMVNPSAEINTERQEQLNPTRRHEAKESAHSSTRTLLIRIAVYKNCSHICPAIQIFTPIQQ